MNKIITTYNGGMPFVMKDLNFIQTAVENDNTDIIDVFTHYQPYVILKGLIYDGNTTVSEGTIVVNGKTYKIPQTTVLTSYPAGYNIRYIPNYNAEGLKKFKNGYTHDTYKINTAILDTNSDINDEFNVPATSFIKYADAFKLWLNDNDVSTQWTPLHYFEQSNGVRNFYNYLEDHNSSANSHYTTRLSYRLSAFGDVTIMGSFFTNSIYTNTVGKGQNYNVNSANEPNVQSVDTTAICEIPTEIIPNIPGYNKMVFPVQLNYKIGYKDGGGTTRPMPAVGQAIIVESSTYGWVMMINTPGSNLNNNIGMGGWINISYKI